MPANIRPSWIDVNVEGRHSDIGTGPKRRDGQMTIDAKVRNEGSILDLLKINFIGSGDGKSVLVEITDKRNGSVIFSERFNQ